jgi:hypothetical protein
MPSPSNNGLVGKVTIPSLVPPMVAFLVAGLTKLVNWDVGAIGFVLLCGFAALGLCLPVIPRKSVLWTTAPGSSQSTLKQTIGTIRVLVSIVLVASPLIILATSDKILSLLPEGVEPAPLV